MPSGKKVNGNTTGHGRTLWEGEGFLFPLPVQENLTLGWPFAFPWSSVKDDYGKPTHSLALLARLSHLTDLLSCRVNVGHTSPDCLTAWQSHTCPCALHILDSLEMLDVDWDLGPEPGPAIKTKDWWHWAHVRFVFLLLDTPLFSALALSGAPGLVLVPFSAL